MRKSGLFFRKWLLRIAVSFMLGFSNAINQETKNVEDTSFKTEQRIED